MTDFVQMPNLPHCAETLIIGMKYRYILEKPLLNLGINVLWLADNPDIDVRLASHCDLSVLHLGGKHFMLAPYLKGSNVAKITDIGAKTIFADINQGRIYPNDAQLNQCIIGRYRIFNPKTACDPSVNNFTNIVCHQGYTRCSICVVSENALITSDRMIAEKAGEQGIDALLISQGGIVLDGFDYGFIGGASFKLAENRLAFTGHLNAHPDKTEIERFVSLHNSEIIFLTELPAFDIGGCVQITEK